MCHLPLCSQLWGCFSCLEGVYCSNAKETLTNSPGNKFSSFYMREYQTELTSGLAMLYKLNS